MSARGLSACLQGGAAEPAAPPAERAFDNPALRLDGKARLIRRRRGSLQLKPERFLKITFEITAVGLISEDHFKAHASLVGLFDELEGVLALGLVGGADADGPRPALGVCEDVAFSPFDLFVAVKAAQAA